MAPKRRGRHRWTSAAQTAVPPAHLVFRASEDDAWYSVRLRLEAGATLRVMYCEFSESTDERFAADMFGSVSEVEAFGGRFRLDLEPAEDCRRVEAGMRVCAYWKFSDLEKRFHDAVVDSVSRADGEGKCSCTFELLWQHGKLVAEKTCVGIEKIYLIQSGGPQVDPILERFLDVAKDRVKVRNSKAGSISESLGNGVEPMSWSNDYSGIKESMKSRSFARNPKVMTLKTNVKNTFPETQEKASKLSEFLFNPLHIIMSLRGRPWMLSQKWYGSMEGKMPKYEDESWIGKREHLTKLKLVTANSKEYTMGMKILEVCKEFYEHIEGLHQTLETGREQIASKFASQEKLNYLRR